MADQTTVTQTLPAPFIEALGKTYADKLTTEIGNLQGLDVSKIYGPQFVAGPSALQQEAQTLAGGLGSYQPYLQQAGQLGQTAQGYIGPGAYQQFMSPYQQDVINTALSQYDIQAQKGAQGIPAQAIAAGAFGGGREGIQRAEYQNQSDLNRAQLQANLLQQGYGQAQQAAQNAYGQTLGLGQYTMGLGQGAESLLGGRIGTLSTLGAQQQAQSQAQLEAQKQLAYQQIYQPLQTTQELGKGVMGLISGYPQQMQLQTTPSPTPLQTALGVGSTLAGIYGALKPSGNFNIYTGQQG
jgi:hypothetical protein